MAQIVNQTGIVLDAISHGEIEGLVNGGRSIYLENTPLNTSNTGVESERASMETVQTKATCNTSNTFTVPLASVKHIIDRETYLDTTVDHTKGDLKTTEVRYLWLDKAGPSFGGFYQTGNIIAHRYRTGSSMFDYASPNLSYLQKFAEGPRESSPAFGHETDKTDLHFTYTIDSVPNYRSFLTGGIRVRQQWRRGGSAYYYDFGKLWHSVNGKYELIAARKFDVSDIASDNSFNIHENYAYRELDKCKSGIMDMPKRYSNETPDQVVLKTEFNDVIKVLF